MVLAVPLLATILVALSNTVVAQPSTSRPQAPKAGPLTVAEASGYTKTSTFKDVVAFLDGLDGLEHASRLRRQVCGKTVEGRELPLVIVSDPPLRDDDAIMGSGKLRLLVIANIHAGEVEGKAAAQVVLTVNDKPRAEGARDVEVHTIGSEGNLRYLDWVRSRAAYVDELPQWWPKDFLVTGGAGPMRFEARPGGQLVESTDDGSGVLWATVLAMDAGKSIDLVAYLAENYGGPATSFHRLVFEDNGRGGTTLQASDWMIGVFDAALPDRMNEGWQAIYGSLREFALRSTRSTN